MPVWSPSSRSVGRKLRRKFIARWQAGNVPFCHAAFLFDIASNSIVMTMRTCWCLLLGVLSVGYVAPLHAQHSGCTLERQDYYQCNHDAFQNQLNAVKAVRVDSGRMDVYGRAEVTKLVEGMGKTLVTPSQRADLTFQLTWIDHSGRIDFGPGEVAVARLNVYDPSRGAGERGLVWVETLTGQEDLPWPSMVEQLLRQFKEHFPK